MHLQPPSGISNAGMQIVDQQCHQKDDHLSKRGGQKNSAPICESAQQPMLKQRPDAPSMEGPIAGDVLKTDLWHQGHYEQGCRDACMQISLVCCSIASRHVKGA